MLSRNDILETIRMIDQQHLDIRTITMGISLLSCADSSAERACEKIYDKISRYAERLVATGEEIEREFGIPIVNKRVSVTPIALVAAASETGGVCTNGMSNSRRDGENANAAVLVTLRPEDFPDKSTLGGMYWQRSIEQRAYASMEGEISSQRIGDMVMEELKATNDVAYVRFAAVYRLFTDIGTFMQELQKLLDEGKK